MFQKCECVIYSAAILHTETLKGEDSNDRNPNHNTGHKTHQEDPEKGNDHRNSQPNKNNPPNIGVILENALNNLFVEKMNIYNMFQNEKGLLENGQRKDRKVIIFKSGIGI